MLVHLATLGDVHLDQPAAAFHVHASTDRVGSHQLTDSPELAEIVLFTQSHMLAPDWRLRRIRRHPLTQAHPRKVMVYDESDVPWCAFPGVYVNMPARGFLAAHQRPFGYFVPEPDGSEGPSDLLFSFIGSDTAGCRRPLFHLRHPDAVVEEARGFRFWDAASEDFEERRARFRSTLARSRFVLCPRGNGTSSIRLYETLAAGAVPVIISDEWVAPAGPDWERFSLRWPEGRIDGLIELLEARDGDWPQMSHEARRAYEEHFSAAVYFHNVIERCADLVRSGSPARFPATGVIDRHTVAVAATQLGLRGRYAAEGLLRRAGRVVSR